jgi:DNA gyrase subunit B
MNGVSTERGQAYDASSIVVLTGLQAVRERPAMYIGATGHQGIYHLVHEVIQNSVDEAMAGCCTEIDVTVRSDGSYVIRDNGRGIPVDVHEATGRPACEVVLTTLHSGAKFRRQAYSMAGGLHGVGLSCVNALSDRLLLRIGRNGRLHEQSYVRGEPSADLRVVGDSAQSGTSVEFHPDLALFGVDAAAGHEGIRERLLEIAYLHKGLTTRFILESAGETETYAFDSGPAGYVAHLNRARAPVHPEPMLLAGAANGISVTVALQWTLAYSEEPLSFVNGVSTSRGGTHVDGLNAALTRVLNRFAEAQGILGAGVHDAIPGFDLREGLTSVLSIKMDNPQFDGQTKSVLTSAAASLAVERVVTHEFTALLEQDPNVGLAIVAKALEASRARSAARRASERARYRSADTVISKEVYKAQFGIRSKNWHESARWITDGDLLATHAKATRVDKDAKVLDVCCGSGVVGASFRGRVGKIIGLDLTPQMIQLAKTRLDEVHQGDVYDLPFETGSFDLVCNREVLHLLPQPERPVAQIFRVLRPGGQFIVGQWVPFSAVDAAWMFRIVKKKQPLFFNNLTAERMMELLTGAGFVDIETTEYLQWEDIDTWIDTHETPSINRHEIRDLYHNCPKEVRAVHPFEISPTGQIRDCWRWVIFSAKKPGEPAPKE